MKHIIVLYPKKFEEKVGFDRIREKLKTGCLSELGRQKVDNIRFSSNSKFLDILLSQVKEFKDVMTLEEDFPLHHVIDAREAIRKIKVIGTWLLPEEVFDIKRSMETIKAVLHFFKKKEEEEKYPYLNRLSQGVKLYPYLFKRMDQIITNQGRIKDNASDDLKTIRREIRTREGNVSKRINAILKQAQSNGIVEKDVSLAIREGRAVIPVDASKKRKIKGFILDESATGKTAYIEPIEIVEINNELKELGYAEDREIVKILTQLADDFRPYADDILDAFDYLGTLDLIRSKARFAQTIGAEKPAFYHKTVLRWYGARHPLLYLALKKEEREVVPLDIALNHNDQRILLISGPNAGGKSVCLQTVGLIQYMLQCGLLVPVKENSEMGVFQKIFINIGDDQSIDNDLSTYSSHLMAMKEFVKHADKRSLVLIDEFGAGTEPTLGGAIAESILQELNEKATMGVITTHYSNLKHYSSSVKGIQNAAMLFDTEKMNPLFKLSIGEPGSSFAFEIARKIGMPESILKAASSRIGKEHIDFDKNLKDIIRDKRYWERKRESSRIAEKNLQKMIEEYSQELEDAKKLRKETLKKAKSEAEDMLAEVNKKIENTIRAIKESQAEKEATKAARKELEAYKQKVLDQEKEDEKIQRKMEKLRARSKKVGTKKEKQQPVAQKKQPTKVLEAGDKVKMANQDVPGEVLEVNGKRIMVAFGNIITTVSSDKLEQIDEKEYEKEVQAGGTGSGAYWDFQEKTTSFHPEIDVRGKRANEALDTVRDFIESAIVVNASQVRILHGKGDGILRQLIREYLSSVDLVRRYHDEHVQFGGSGITVVEFDS